VDASHVVTRTSARRSNTALVLVILLTGANPALCHDVRAATSADSQVWNELDIAASVTRQLELTWVSLARLSSAKRGVATYANGLYVGIAIGHHLTLTPFYDEYVVTNSATGQWLHTREPGMDATISGALHSCRLADRSRLYRVVDQGFWVYRNRPGVDCRVGSEPSDTTVFVADELFHYTSFGGWTRNRFTSGARIGLDRRCALVLYYLRQVDERQLPRRIDALGITVELSLTGSP
jgi:hypothetical protein